MNDSPHRLALGQWLQILYWFVNPHRLIRISFVSVLVGLIGVAGTYGEPPVVPGTNQVVCYERIQPIFQVKSIPREQGDALLAALDGGRQTQEWTVPPGIEFPIPIPASIWLNVVLTNGSSYCIGFSSQGELVYLPDRLYEVKEAARQRIAKVIEQLDEDLRQQVITAPKPLVYTVGTLDDGGTLWGIAHLFYGDGKKWQQIYGANRESIKNPNMINDGMQLTIPKLQ